MVHKCTASYTLNSCDRQITRTLKITGDLWTVHGHISPDELVSFCHVFWSLCTTSCHITFLCWDKWPPAIRQTLELLQRQCGEILRQGGAHIMGFFKHTETTPNCCNRSFAPWGSGIWTGVDGRRAGRGGGGGLGEGWSEPLGQRHFLTFQSRCISCHIAISCCDWSTSPWTKLGQNC